MDKKKIVILVISIILILCAIALGCWFFIYNDEVVDDRLATSCENDIELTDTEVLLLINSTSLIVDFEDDESIYNALQLTTEFDNEILVCDSKDYEISLDGEVLEDEEPVYFSLDSLSSDEYIDVSITSDEDEKDIKIRTLHEDINFTVEGESEDGYYYFDYNNAAVKTNSKGEVVFYKYSDFIRNFKRYEVDGEIYYGYLERSYEYDNVDTDGCAHMRLVVLNEYYQVIDEVDYLISGDDISENYSIENHEYQILGLGHYIVTGYVALEVDNVPSDLTTDGTSNALVAAAVFQEIKDGELVFEFNSANYPELYEYSTDGNEFGIDNYEDYAHQNSVIIDPSDDNYIVSLRGLDSILKIDSDTGDIIWILGGEGDMFGITDEMQTSRQHYATISINGTLTVYDNGRESEQSRIVEYTLDEENLEIIEFSEYQIDGYYGSIRGSAIRTEEDEDVFLAAWGWTQDNDAIITEYNYETGEKIIEFYDGTGGSSKNYRAHKYDA